MLCMSGTLFFAPSFTYSKFRLYTDDFKIVWGFRAWTIFDVCMGDPS